MAAFCRCTISHHCFLSIPSSKTLQRPCQKTPNLSSFTSGKSFSFTSLHLSLCLCCCSELRILSCYSEAQSVVGLSLCLCCCSELRILSCYSEAQSVVGLWGLLMVCSGKGLLENLELGCCTQVEVDCSGLLVVWRRNQA